MITITVDTKRLDQAIEKFRSQPITLPAGFGIIAQGAVVAMSAGLVPGLQALLDTAAESERTATEEKLRSQFDRSGRRYSL